MYFIFLRRVSSFPKRPPTASINKHIEYGLKQLYLKVHPDFFTSYGEKYVLTNTQSLKELNSFINSLKPYMNISYQLFTPISYPLPKYSLHFYLKPQIKSETIKLINHDIIIPTSLLKTIPMKSNVSKWNNIYSSNLVSLLKKANITNESIEQFYENINDEKYDNIADFIVRFRDYQKLEKHYYKFIKTAPIKDVTTNKGYKRYSYPQRLQRIKYIGKNSLITSELNISEFRYFDKRYRDIFYKHYEEFDLDNELWDKMKIIVSHNSFISDDNPKLSFDCTEKEFTNFIKQLLILKQNNLKIS